MRALLLGLALLAALAVAAPASALGSLHKCVVTNPTTICFDVTGEGPDPAALGPDVVPTAGCTDSLPPTACVLEVDVNGDPVLEAIISFHPH
ncbi:MAG: hypothetical protein LC624_00290 [Halobacteriales archaeon]|nr:hypothetical protein [Halobacteriales archaeon]